MFHNFNVINLIRINWNICLYKVSFFYKMASKSKPSRHKLMKI